MIGKIVKVRVEKDYYLPAIVVKDQGNVCDLHVFGSGGGLKLCVLKGENVGQYCELNDPEVGPEPKYEVSGNVDSPSGDSNPDPQVEPEKELEPQDGQSEGTKGKAD